MFELNQDKVNTITRAFHVMRNIDRPIKSIADLGGVWGVGGGYTFDTLKKHNLDRAFLVDTHITPEVLEKSKAFPNLLLLQANFATDFVRGIIGDVDAVILFDVLLHQVNPDWDSVLRVYAEQTNCFIVFQPQWIKSKGVVRLIDFNEDEYFSNVPHLKTHPAYLGLYSQLDEIHPEHNKPRKDVHHIWQWGISDSALIDRMMELGFRMVYTANFKGWHTLPNFENHAFIFVKQAE